MKKLINLFGNEAFIHWTQPRPFSKGDSSATGDENWFVGVFSLDLNTTGLSCISFSFISSCPPKQPSHLGFSF